MARPRLHHVGQRAAGASQRGIQIMLKARPTAPSRAPEMDAVTQQFACSGATALDASSDSSVIRVGADEKVYPVGPLLTVVESLAREGIRESQALEGTRLTSTALRSHETRLSLSDCVRLLRNALELSRDPHIGFRAGQRIHASTLGMYGFALLSSPSLWSAVHIGARFHQIAMPLIRLEFQAEQRRAVWVLQPISHPDVDRAVSKLIVELYLSAGISLHREIAAASFAPLAIHLTADPPCEVALYERLYGCPVRFAQAANELIFDAAWLDRPAILGNEAAHAETVKLCELLLKQLHARTGVAGRVRGLLLSRLPGLTSCAAVAKQLHLAERTLRRRLRDEQTSFRDLVHEVRMEAAIKFLRETDLTVQQIAHSLGFSDDASFRHAFRRWTNAAPIDFRTYKTLPE